MRKIIGAALAAGVACTAASAGAAVVSFNMSVEFSGASAPEGAAPWIRATFDDGGTAGSVQLTMEGVNLVASEFVREWYFNLDPALNPKSLVFSAPSKVGTFDDPTIATGVNAFQADGDGLYDILVSFPHAPPGVRFGGTDQLAYTIAGIPTLTANSFNFLSFPAGNHGPFLTAAHVQGIGVDGEESGWVTVPEPAGMALLGLGVLPLLRRRRLT